MLAHFSTDVNIRDYCGFMKRCLKGELRHAGVLSEPSMRIPLRGSANPGTSAASGEASSVQAAATFAFRFLSIRRAGLSALLALLFSLAGGFASPLRAREIHIEGFHSDLVVLPDSTLDVTETIHVEFVGSYQGLYRTIPVEYDGPGGFNYSLFLSDIHANLISPSGDPLRIEKHRQGRNLEFKIYVPDASDSRRVIVLHYRVSNALRYFDDHDELYWNVTGTDWQVPVGNVSAHIVLPQGVTGLDASDYTGTFGSRAQDASVEVVGSNVDIHTTRPLAYREGLTVVVGWDKGFVHAPTAGEKIAQFLESNWALFIPVLAFGVMFWLWRSRGRDPRVGAIAVQYEPPAGLSPGEAGTLVDNSAAMRDITATTVDLAVHGYLTIEEQTKEHMLGIYSNKEYVFHLEKTVKEWGSLKPHEALLLRGLFDDGERDQVTLSELQNKFYRNLPGIRSAILDALVERGYYTQRPDRMRQSFMAAAIVAAVLLFLGGQYGAQLYGMAPLGFFLAAVLTGLIIAGFGWVMSARTADGMRALNNVLGFEDFLGHVEKDRMERLERTPATFEKYLPYAMALNVEKKWVSAFDGIFTEPPAWFRGTAPGAVFYPMAFVSSMDTMSARAGQMMTSAPRSSAGGSGFGGGGGSGGGFGGGGGGGF